MFFFRYDGFSTSLCGVALNAFSKNSAGRKRLPALYVLKRDDLHRFERDALCQLRGVKLVVVTTLVQKLLMRAGFHDVAVHDVTQVPELLTGEEEVVYGDSGYLGAENRENAVKKNSKGKKINYKINRRPSQSKNKSARAQAQIKRREHEKSSVRSKVEHVFAVVKGQFGFRKTRYKGRRKQQAKLNMMFALANIIIADRRGFTTV